MAMAILAVYGTRRAVALKYLVPGLLFLLALQVWPIVYTVGTAFTNFGDGHRISKQESIDSIIANSVQEVPGSSRYKLSVAVKQGADIATAPPVFLLTDPKGKTLLGDASGLEDLTADGVEKSPLGKVTAAPGYTILNARQVNARKDLATFAVPTPDGGGIKRVGLSEAFEGKPSVSYDKATDTLTDSATKKQYVPRNAEWVPKDGQGEAFAQGWKENVGLKNFTTGADGRHAAHRLREDLRLEHGLRGVLGAVDVPPRHAAGPAAERPAAQGRKAIYRSLLILPYAMPTFVTALVWKSMYNQDFGLINSYTGLNVDWLGNPWAAKAAILVTNLWLGFPYMFIVCTGALQSIPGDVREAAKIDGASAFRMLRSIIMPLLLVAVGPLLIASFAFNFNNFTPDLPADRRRPLRLGQHLDRLERPADHLRLPARLQGHHPELRVRCDGLDLHLHHRRVAELLRIPSDQVPGRGELMSEVSSARAGDPHDEVEGAGFTPPPARAPAPASGQRTWWQHGLVVVALDLVAVPRRVPRVGGAQPGRLARDEPADPDQCVARQLPGPVHRRGAAVRVLVQELAAHRRRRLAVLGLHRRLCGVRLLPTEVHRPPAGSADTAAAADVPRPARVRGALRHLRDGR